MLGVGGMMGRESVIGGEGASHPSSTTDLRQIALPSQIASRPEAVDEETTAETEGKVPTSLIINTDCGHAVSDETSRGETVEINVACATENVVEETIYAVETTIIALVPGQDRSGRAEIELHGTVTDESIAQEPGHTEEAATRAEPVLQENVIVLSESDVLLGILIVLEGVVIQRFSDPPSTLDAIAFTTCNVVLLCLVPAERRTGLMMATVGLAFQAWKIGVLPLAVIIATGIMKASGAMPPGNLEKW
ncbi:hypothetical protein IEO21_09758 [Rhodonia placenta]|uniref:Uncharacterized protein n=1 Tax=Rhodonia placenta TaxID=104341 RepID=A0A8H7TXE7_9APHY|nr:hypothetical protein IEO21_09758 [Postia placenta]